MTTIITAERVLELLDAAVEDRGEKYRYPSKAVSWQKPFYGEKITDEQVLPNGVVATKSDGQQRDLDEAGACHYFATPRDAELAKMDEGAPMCIVGWVLDAIGYKPEDLDPYSNIGAGVDTVSELLARARPELGQFDVAAVETLDTAQTEQDGGTAWGGARDIARRDHLSRTDEL